MTEKPFLNPTGEDAWLRIRQHLEWCDHFALGFIFTEHPGVVRIFRERLVDIYRARGTRLETVTLERPDDFFTKLLSSLLRLPSDRCVLDKPAWIDVWATEERSGAAPACPF